MRWVLFVVGFVGLVVFGMLPATALGAPGDLDLGFGVDGIVYSDLATAPDRLTVLPDGRLFTLYGLTFRCYQADGTVDPTFGVDPGTGATNDAVPAVNLAVFGMGGQRYADARVQPDTGRILVWQGGQGRIGVVYPRIVGLVALTSNGMPDVSFGNGGFLTTPDDSLYKPTSIDMAADGSFIVGAYSAANGGDAVLFRYTPDGQLDTTFGTGGVWSKDFASHSVDIVSGVAALSGGRILVNGSIQESTGFCMRLLPDGAPDPSFHDGGLWVIPPGNGLRGGGHWYDARLIELGNGDLIALPLHFGYGGSIYRMKANATLDPDYPEVFVGSGANALLADNSIVVTGMVDRGYPTYRDFFVRRYTPAWLPDETFAPKGIVYKDFGAADDSPSAAVLPDGKILVGGVTIAPASGVSSRAPQTAASVVSVPATSGILFRLLGGGRTNLATKLTRGGKSSVSLTLRSGQVKWPTTAKLTSNGTPVGGLRVKLMRSRNARSWTIAASATTMRGVAKTTVRLTRRGTYYFRWSFAGTASYRKATSAVTKVIVK